jgi:hypothetical protein
MQHFTRFFLKFKSNLLSKRVFFKLKAVFFFSMAILDLIHIVQGNTNAVRPNNQACLSSYLYLFNHLRSYSFFT